MKPNDSVMFPNGLKLTAPIGYTILSLDCDPITVKGHEALAVRAILVKEPILPESTADQPAHVQGIIG